MAWLTPARYDLIRKTLLKRNKGARAEIKRFRDLECPGSADAMAAAFVEAILAASVTIQAGTRRKEVALKALADSGHVSASEVPRGLLRDRVNSIWSRRNQLFEGIPAVADRNDPDHRARAVAWCSKILGTKQKLGTKTSRLAAKLLGADVAAPDRWLKKYAAVDSSFDEERVTPRRIQKMCERIAATSGDRVSVVDTVLLWAATEKPPIVKFKTVASISA